MTFEADQKFIVFMKVGSHAGETFDDILERKRQEFQKTGRIFWGYGGGTMHPIMRVQPFVSMHVQHGATVSIVMQEMSSKHPATNVFAKEFSRDGQNWEPIPEGVSVRGSRYALVLDELKEGDLMLNLHDYVVGAGPSRGRNAADYIKGRVDKGLLARNDQPVNTDEPKVLPIRYSATLKEPFAVLLRT